eukprot:s7080_g3.t1
MAQPELGPSAPGPTTSPLSEKLLTESGISAREVELVQRCLGAVEERARKLEDQGMTKKNFVFGVANSLFVAWSFGALPGYFWIVYIMEVCVLLPIRWRKMINASPKQHLYWLDFCWMANFFGVFLLLALMVCSIPPGIQRWCMCASWGLGTGTLLCATTALGNALLFHDLDNVCAVLIHLFPSLVMYELGWKRGDVHAAWPRIFLQCNFFESLDPMEIISNACLVYGVWFLLYVSWLLAFGLRCPKHGYDTIFHWAMRGSAGSVVAKILRRQPEVHATYAESNDFPREYVFVYMALHAASVLVSIPVSLLCYASQWIHVSLCACVVLSTIYNASARYTFYMVKSYTVALKKESRIPRDRGASALLSDEDRS